MRIYSMTATFGKLEHTTLTLEPGLNILEAPNEWGKSTWCAFLVNMLYGLETRAKSTKALLADKEKYAPWSGAPMAGRMELQWQGRDITIERNTKGRLLFGDFRAYETATGVDIPELNGSNCGQMLLGVERSVFLRSAFLKLSDLPVTQDDALRRRLNNLVTTGDESDAGDRLGKQLKELKNKCRYNHTGLLPQAEAEQQHLADQLEELQQLKAQIQAVTLEQEQLQQEIESLENHADTLRYAASLETAEKVAAAQETSRQAQLACQTLEAHCQTLPSLETAQAAVSQLQALQLRQEAMDAELSRQPAEPTPPPLPPRYAQGVPEAEQAQEDARQVALLQRSMKQCRDRSLCAYGLAVIVAACGAGLWLARIAPVWVFAAGLLLAMVLAFAAFRLTRAAIAKDNAAIQMLLQRYAPLSPEAWEADVRSWQEACRHYDALLSQYRSAAASLEERKQALAADIHSCTQGKTLLQALPAWQETVSQWQALQTARQQAQQADAHAQALSSLFQIVPAPSRPDTRTESEAQTNALLTDARFRLHQLQRKLGQYQGRSEALGQEAVLRAQWKAVSQRVLKLQETYQALELALNTLSNATTQLQRRFAPRISKKTQELFSRLTGGRYQRIALGEDLSLSTCTEQEDTLRSAQWRSEGTVDQLYLALRLAVSQELTPEAPLVLDDALVRFDDTRLAEAVTLLQAEGREKQILLFTCQSREARLLQTQ